MQYSRDPPWTFHTTSLTACRALKLPPCDPLTYGYRGLAVTWDFVRGGYQVDDVSERDGLNFADEAVVPRYDDFHRLYAPYRRLVGADVMKRHLSAAR